MPPRTDQRARRRRPAVAVLVHLRRARDLIDRRYAESLDLDALAREAGFSRYHFSREFRAAFGETPGGYLTRRRIERAQELLRTGNLTVTEVCTLVGFSALGSFSARFSALVGCSPSAYRREHVARGPAPPVPGCFLMAWTRPGAGNAAIAEKPGPDPHP